jgi:hypothetical protein
MYLRMPDLFAPHEANAREVLSWCGADALHVLVGMLDDNRADVRTWAALRLGGLRAEAAPAVPALIQALGDEDEAVRYRAACALGEVGPGAKAAVMPVIDSLRREPNAHLQANLAETLGRIGPASFPAVPELTRLLDSATWGARRNAADALGSIGPAAKSSVTKLTELLCDEEESVRSSAARALGLIGVRTEAAVDGLKRLFDDKYSDVRACAIVAAWRLTGQPELVMPTMVRDLEESDPFSCFESRELAETLIEIGPAGRDAEPALVREHAREVSFCRAESFLALWSVRGRPGGGLLPLLKALKYPGEQADVVSALGDLGQGARNAVPALRTLLRDASEDERVRAAAAEALRKIEAAEERE